MKHVIITGGSSGIGKGLAELYLKEGCTVSLIARRLELLESCKNDFLAKGFAAENVNIYVADVTNEEEISKVITEAIQKENGVDVLIASAGFSRPGYFMDQEVAIFKKSFDINLFGVLYAVRAVLPTMEAQNDGKIVLISSGAALIGIFGSSSYCSSKYAVRGLAEVLRSECKPKGIQVSIAFPPDTDTPMMEVNKGYKPYETQMVMGSGGFFTVEKVAKTIFRGVNKGRFGITIGTSLALLYRLGSLLLPLVNRGFDKKIAKVQKERVN